MTYIETFEALNYKLINLIIEKETFSQNTTIKEKLKIIKVLLAHVKIKHVFYTIKQ